MSYPSYQSHRVQKALVAFLLSVTAGLAIAGTSNQPVWRIDSKESSLTFNTTKSANAGTGGVTETLRFTRYDGGVDAQGHIAFKIDLSSIDSGIPIRDERLQSMFWNVGNQFPEATFSADLKPDVFKKINKEGLTLDIEGSFTIAGQTKPIKAKLQSTPVNGQIIVSTREPILIKADDFGLASGAEALRNIMGLNYLSSTAPVNFSLHLRQAR